MSLVMGEALQSLIAANAVMMGLNWVEIPGGTFLMGASDLGADGLPPHEATVSAFRMGKSPVTLGEHRALLDRLGPNRFALLSEFKDLKPKIMALADREVILENIPIQKLLCGVTIEDLLVGGGRQVFDELKIIEMKMPELDPKFCHPHKPIVIVNWYESIAHALLRGALLATEAQWEYAATCGGKFKYGTYSGTLGKKMAHYFPQKATAEVEHYPPNSWGLNDMTGNVSEWCMDLFGSSLSERQTDSRDSAEDGFRVFRGGSWFSLPPKCLRAAYRVGFDPEDRADFIGFRLASA